MVPTAESTEKQGLGAGNVEIAAAHGAAAELARRTKKARPDAGTTKFRGVRRLGSGMHGSQIWDSSRRSNVWIGTVATAEDAARAYDAAAVEMHGASAKTNFGVDDGVDVQVVGLVEAAAWSGFRGVCQLQSGRADDSVRRARLCLGIFGTAEYAASAYHAAVAELHGARATTSFKQPPTAAADDDGEEESPMDLSDFPELLAVDLFSDSIVPGAQLDDLLTDLPQA